jgi:DNA-binding response OmpR family regulator
VVKLLVVEDDPEVSSALRAALEAAGFYVEIVRDGERALRVAAGTDIALILLDLMLPSRDGVSLCRKLRDEMKVTTPILMLTARDTVQDRVIGLEAGADDYLGKPFELAELLARVRALLRRNRVHKSSVIRIADLEIDTATQRVTRAGRLLHLTRREYTLLENLAGREGIVISRDDIRRFIWQDAFSKSNNVDVHIGNLRRKVDDGHSLKLIQTVLGVGYVLRPERVPTSP